MIIDLDIKGKYVVVVGGGLEGYRKGLDFLGAGARVLVVSDHFSSNVIELFKQGKIAINKLCVTDPEKLFENLNSKPDIFVSVTNNRELNENLITFARSKKCLVYAPDRPELSDFILPAVSQIGSIQIAVSTSGKSPAMAGLLKKRIEAIITPVDLYQIELQSFLREKLKVVVLNQRVRKNILYDVIGNPEIISLLNQGALDQAKMFAVNLVNTYLSKPKLENVKNCEEKM